MCVYDYVEGRKVRRNDELKWELWNPLNSVYSESHGMYNISAEINFVLIYGRRSGRAADGPYSPRALSEVGWIPLTVAGSTASTCWRRDEVTTWLRVTCIPPRGLLRTLLGVAETGQSNSGRWMNRTLRSRWIVGTDCSIARLG